MISSKFVNTRCLKNQKGIFDNLSRDQKSGAIPRFLKDGLVEKNIKQNVKDSCFGASCIAPAPILKQMKILCKYQDYQG